MKKKIHISLVFGVGLSLVMLFLAFRNVPLAELGDYLGAINYLWLLPSGALVLFGFVLRTMRWQLILAASRKVSFRQTYHPLMIGFMLNCILPGRIGEAARPLILYREIGLPFATGIATVAAERLLDALFLLLMLATALSTVPMSAAAAVSFAGVELNRDALTTLGEGLFKLCIFITICCILVGMDRPRGFIKALLERIGVCMGRRLPPALRPLITRRLVPFALGVLDHAASGLAFFRDPWKLAGCVFLSSAVWATTVFSYQVMAMGCPGVSLALHEFAVVMAVICIFIALPSVPGFWGVWEAGGVFALSLFGVAGETAAGFTLANHAVQMFPVIIAGLVSAAALSINIFRVSHNTTGK